MGHDALIHEFERLTSDLDGLLGLLEEILHEGGGDPNFEAKKLLCVLFQVHNDYHNFNMHSRGKLHTC